MYSFLFGAMDSGKDTEMTVKRNIKRIIAMLMMALMMVSFMPTMSVFADESAGSEISGPSQDEEPAAPGEDVEPGGESEGSEVTELTEPAPGGESEGEEDTTTTAIVDVTVSDGGVIVEDKDGQFVALSPVVLTGKAAYTLKDVFTAIHEQYHEKGIDAFATEDTQWGEGLVTVWGETTGGNFTYYKNHEMAYGLADSAADGDYVSIHIIRRPSFESYAYFTDTGKFDAIHGKEMTFTLMWAHFDESWNEIRGPLADATITLNGEETEYVTDAEGRVTILFEKAGKYVVSAVKKDENGTIITAPAAIVNANHNFEFTKGFPATCTEVGQVDHYICSECNWHAADDKGTPFDPMSDAWVIPAFGHAWGEWTVVKKPTTTEEGEEQRVCANDPTHIEKRAVAKLDDLSGTKDDNKKEEKKAEGKAADKKESKPASKSTNPKTGDEQVMGLYVMLFAAASVVTLVLRKRAK